jgi:hypothetical protein
LSRKANAEGNAKVKEEGKMVSTKAVAKIIQEIVGSRNEEAAVQSR